MANSKLGRTSKERRALLRGQVSTLLWNGYLETTVTKAKAVKRQTEKLLTLAINSYEDVIKTNKTKIDEKGEKFEQEVLNDGPKKLTARRRFMGYCYDLQEQRREKESKDAFIARTKDINHPLIEKIFNVYAVKLAKRAKDLNQGGGYIRILKLQNRRGDNAPMARLEIILD